jgi:hypothetical protein
MLNNDVLYPSGRPEGTSAASDISGSGQAQDAIRPAARQGTTNPQASHPPAPTDSQISSTEEAQNSTATSSRDEQHAGRDGDGGGRDRERDQEPSQQALKVLFTNAQSLPSKINELEVLVIDTEPVIVFICETWCNTDIPNASLNINGYKFQTDLRIDRADTAHGVGGGLAVYTKNGLEILVCDQVHQFNQYCKLKINACGEELYFYVVYRPPSGGLASKQLLGEVIRSVEKKCIMVILQSTRHRLG